MSNVLEIAITTRLRNTSAITSLLAGTASVYNSVAPSGATYPAIIFNQQANTLDNDNPHRAEQAVYQIKAVSLSGFVQAGNIDAAVDAAFHMLPLSVAGWSNFWLARESEIRFVEVASDSVRYWHVGGLYRVRVGK